MSEPSQPTKERILDAACDLFSRQGFQDTTTQQICEAAEANIAAVHYHHQSKENLYREVWRRLAADAERYWQAAIDPGSSAETRLRQFVKLRVEMALAEGPQSRFPRLVHCEMNNPTPLHEELRDQYLRPRHDWFVGVIREILGSGVDDHILHLATFCIHSPLIHLMEMRNRPHAPKGAKSSQRPGMNPADLIDTILAFALGGLRELTQVHGAAVHNTR